MSEDDRIEGEIRAIDLFEQFKAEFDAGDMPDVEPLLRQAGSHSDVLRELIERYVVNAAPPEPTLESLAKVVASPAFRRLFDSIPEQGGRNDARVHSDASTSRCAHPANWTTRLNLNGSRVDVDLLSTGGLGGTHSDATLARLALAETREVASGSPIFLVDRAIAAAELCQRDGAQEEYGLGLVGYARALAEQAVGVLGSIPNEVLDHHEFELRAEMLKSISPLRDLIASNSVLEDFDRWRNDWMERFATTLTDRFDQADFDTRPERIPVKAEGRLEITPARDVLESGLISPAAKVLFLEVEGRGVARLRVGLAASEVLHGQVDRDGAKTVAGADTPDGRPLFAGAAGIPSGDGGVAPRVWVHLFDRESRVVERRIELEVKLEGGEALLEAELPSNWRACGLWVSCRPTLKISSRLILNDALLATRAQESAVRSLVDLASYHEGGKDKARLLAGAVGLAAELADKTASASMQRRVRALSGSEEFESTTLAGDYDSLGMRLLDYCGQVRDAAVVAHIEALAAGNQAPAVKSRLLRQLDSLLEDR